MDNETVSPSDDFVAVGPDKAAPSVRSSSLTAKPATLTAIANPDREKTGVFTSLVKEDGDISGLVAYSIYKQNKLDWLQAFEAAIGRAPNEAELASYIIGESTPRRLATYRHLAESTLAGKGPDVERGTTARLGGHSGSSSSTLFTPRMLMLYGVIAVLFVVAFWLAAHYTVSNR